MSCLTYTNCGALAQLINDIIAKLNSAAFIVTLVECFIKFILPLPRLGPY